MAFPVTRPRRLRTTKTMRALVAENRLSVNDLVYPLFTCPGTGVKDPIGSMDGCYHLSPDLIVAEALEIAAGYNKDNKTNLVSSHTDDGKQMGLQYSKFVPILVKAIQEQQALIEALTARITTLEG